MASPTSSPAASTAMTFMEWRQHYKKEAMQGLVNDFLAIKKEDKDQMGPTTNFNQNPTLNRYANIPLLDETRVVLNDGLPRNYVHASYVDGYNRPKEFIITQAPPPEAIIDYWRLVFQEDVRVLVCLTSIQERGSVKADLFFPRSTSRPFRAGPLRISATAVDTVRGFNHVMLARLKLKCWFAKRKGNTKKIMFIHYGDWPDTAVPKDVKAFLKFVRLLRTVQLFTRMKPMPPKDMKERWPTIMVNCSAGVGRSATLVACRIAVDRLEATDQIDIKDLIKKMRKQRAGSVQNYLQYCFIHLLLAEAARHRRIQAQQQQQQRS